MQRARRARDSHLLCAGVISDMQWYADSLLEKIHHLESEKLNLSHPAPVKGIR